MMDSLTCLLSLTLSVVMVTSSYASGGYGNSGYGYGERTNGVDKLIKFGAGFQRVGSGVSAPYSNADRQLAVNLVALRAGTGTGTGLFYGVPGSGIDFGDGSGRHGNRYGDTKSGYGNDNGYSGEYKRHSYYSYGDNRRGNGYQGNSYGSQGNSYGNQGNSYGNQGNIYGNQGNSYGNQGNSYGSQGNSYGSQGNDYGKSNKSYGRYSKSYSYHRGNSNNAYSGNSIHGYQNKYQSGNNRHGQVRYSGPIITKSHLFH